MEREYYFWTAGGATVSAALNPDLINRLRRAAITDDGKEVGGILLGRKVSDDQITVEDFETFDSEHRRGLTFTLSLADRKKLVKRLEDSHKGLQIVGCFRTHMRQGLYMDQYDQEVMSSHFASPSDVMLLVRPRDWQAGLFVWEDADIHRQKSYREFPFDATQLPITPLILPDTDPKPRRRARVAYAEAGRVPFAFSKASLPTLAKVGLVAATFGLVGVLAFYAHEHRASMPSPPSDASSSKLTMPPDGLQAPPAADVNPPFDPDLGTPADSDEMHVKLSEPEPEKRPFPFIAKATPVEAAVEPKTPARTFVPPPPATMPPAPPVETASNIPLSVLDVVKLKPSPPQVVSIVSLEPSEPNLVSRSINHVPVLNLLQRHKYKAGDRFSPASPVRRVNPHLPAELQNAEYQKPIDIKVWIDDNGLVTKALILNDRNESEVADFAAHTALKWTFTPAKVSDQPVSSEMVMHFKFEPRQSY